MSNDIRPPIEQLVELRNNLKEIMKPEVLKELADLLQVLGTDTGQTYLKQYDFWIKKNGVDCRYAAMAKEFFLRDQAKGVAKAINSLYSSFSKFYE